MKKHPLIVIFLASLFALIGVSTVLGVYFFSDVEKLHDHFPVYDFAQKDYVLVKQVPKNWVRLDQVSEFAKWAIVISEDWAFYNHEGVDVQQLKIVLEESIEERELGRGASTITQQVVKNVLLTPKRSIWRKFKELILAYKIEKVLSKNKILEIYLNIVELGDGIYGIKEGARYYFNKEPKSLTAREGAFLAMLLPSPIKYSQSFKHKELTDFARKQVDRILFKLQQAHIYSENDRIQAMQQRFWWEPHNDPEYIPPGAPFVEEKRENYDFEF